MLDTLKNAFFYAKDFCEDTAENIKRSAEAEDFEQAFVRIVKGGVK